MWAPAPNTEAQGLRPMGWRPGVWETEPGAGGLSAAQLSQTCCDTGSEVPRQTHQNRGLYPPAALWP